MDMDSAPDLAYAEKPTAMDRNETEYQKLLAEYEKRLTHIAAPSILWLAGEQQSSKKSDGCGCYRSR